MIDARLVLPYLTLIPQNPHMFPNEGLDENNLLQHDFIRGDEHRALEEIRRESLSPYNRLHSIDEDAQFVKSIHDIYRHLPLIPNLRCGAWYVCPVDSDTMAAYFKSTDGHFNNWSFNLRRPNLHLLSVIKKHHGILLVDSTRAGKRLPDALSKTVPIWCSVVNRTLDERFGLGKASPLNWDNSLYTPPQSVSRQEHDQIENRLPDWVYLLVSSSYDLPQLEKPLRPIWITPSSSMPPISEEDSFYPVVCISASKLISDGLSRRRNGFVYVQGSGDDHELWSSGLTPAQFWKHKKELLNASSKDFKNILTSIVNNASDTVHPQEFSPIKKINGMISIGSVTDLPAFNGDNNEAPQLLEAYLVLTSDPSYLAKAPGRKSEANFLRSILPRSLEFIGAHLQEARNIYIACIDGKDHSVGVATAALQMFFDDTGHLLLPTSITTYGAQVQGRNTANKASIKTRLQWIIASRPEANPSRTTLKRVNEFLLSRSRSTFQHSSSGPGPENTRDIASAR